jgi:hypothetical protein
LGTKAKTPEEWRVALVETRALVSAANAYSEAVALWEVALDLRRARGVELGEAMRAATEAMRASRARGFEEFLANEE